MKYHFIDKNFMEEIDCEWKAYFLGFFYADGNIKDNRSARIYISDKEIIDFFNKSIFINGITKRIIRNDGYSDRFGIDIHSTKVIQDMNNIGLFPNKSLTVDFPDRLINSKFLPDFIRGYFDGDGSVWKTKPKHYKNKKLNYYGVSICVSEKFGKKIKIILENLGIKNSLRKSKSKIHLINIYGLHNIIKFYDYIYQNDTISLKRKKEIFECILQERTTLLKRTPAKYKGIYKTKVSNKWYAQFNNKRIGTFNTEIEAYNGKQKFLVENSKLISN